MTTALTPAGSRYSSTRFQRALRIYYSYKLANLVLASFFQIFLAKVLGPEDYASYAILLAILLASERLLSFGIDRTIMRFVPPLTRDGDFAGLRWLFTRLGLVRVLSLLMMLTAIVLGAPTVIALLPSRFPDYSIHAFLLWFASYALLCDADALAQSWMAHVEVAMAATIEIVTRCAAITLLVALGSSIDAPLVLAICAATNFLALLGLAVRLKLWRMQLKEASCSSSVQTSDLRLDVRQAPVFAAAAYASTVSWLTTSPAVIRILSKGGLDIIAFASFSFIQALCLSLQRGFPGLLVLPSLEPIVARLHPTESKARVFGMLSLVFKIELTGVLAIALVVILSGDNIISLLSRSAYGPYFYILPVLLLTLVLQTIYRICEIVISARLEHGIFFKLWPLSAISALSIYWTVGQWGLLSVLGIPVVEGTIRIAILLVAHKRAQIWRALDPPRSLQICLGATVIGFISFAFRGSYNLEITIASLFAFVGLLFLLKPFRRTEVEYVTSSIAEPLRALRKVILALSRD